MTPLQYCKDRVAQPGSTLYYSLLYLPPGNRDALYALFAFRDELMALLAPSSSMDLSTKKVAWWFDEVERFSSGQPRHPVMRALKDNVCPSAHSVTRDLLVALADEPLSNQDRWQAKFSSRSSSSIALAAALHCGYTNHTNSELVRELGLGCAAAESFRMEKFSDARCIKQTISMLDRTFRTIAQPDRYNLLGLLTMAALNSAFLKRTSLDEEQIRTARDITPVTKLWIAWKTERSERKLSRKHKI